jgi:hypothetical protein
MLLKKFLLDEGSYQGTTSVVPPRFFKLAALQRLR